MLNTQSFWSRSSLPRPSSASDRTPSHRTRSTVGLSSLTRAHTRADILAKLEAVNVPAGPILDLAEVFADPQVQHRGMRLALPCEAAKAGAIPGLRTPITIDGEGMAAQRPAPRLGEHTDDILREIGEA